MPHAIDAEVLLRELDAAIERATKELEASRFARPQTNWFTYHEAAAKVGALIATRDAVAKAAGL